QGRAPRGAVVVRRLLPALAALALLTPAAAAAGAASGDSAAGEGRELRAAVFEATVDLFEDYYWDEDRLDWEAWGARYRQAAVGGETRPRCEAVMRRMVAEVGEDHSRWLGLAGLEPGAAPITAPFEPGGSAAAGGLDALAR